MLGADCGRRRSLPRRRRPRYEPTAALPASMPSCVMRATHRSTLIGGSFWGARAVPGGLWLGLHRDSLSGTRNAATSRGQDQNFEFAMFTSYENVHGLAAGTAFYIYRIITYSTLIPPIRPYRVYALHDPIRFVRFVRCPSPSTLLPKVDRQIASKQMGYLTVYSLSSFKYPHLHQATMKPTQFKQS